MTHTAIAGQLIRKIHSEPWIIRKRYTIFLRIEYKEKRVPVLTRWPVLLFTGGSGLTPAIVRPGTRGAPQRGPNAPFAPLQEEKTVPVPNRFGS